MTKKQNKMKYYDKTGTEISQEIAKKTDIYYKVEREVFDDNQSMYFAYKFEEGIVTNKHSKRPDFGFGAAMLMKITAEYYYALQQYSCLHEIFEGELPNFPIIQRDIRIKEYEQLYKEIKFVPMDHSGHTVYVAMKNIELFGLVKPKQVPQYLQTDKNISEKECKRKYFNHISLFASNPEKSIAIKRVLNHL